MEQEETNKDELNTQIRKFLKKVGVETQQLLEVKLNNLTTSCNVTMKLEIDSVEVKKYETIINKS